MFGGVYYQVQMGTGGVPLVLDEGTENHLRVEFKRCVEPPPVEVLEGDDDVDQEGGEGDSEGGIDSVDGDGDGTEIAEGEADGDVSLEEPEPFCASDDEFILFTKQYQLVVISDVKYLNANDV